MRMFSRALRILSAVTLFFFCWTFLPLYSFVAYAATKEGPGARVQGPVYQDTGARGKGPERPGERFEKALEAIRENVGKADEKESKGQDSASEAAEIKAKKAEIESLDVELRKELSATEKKLKDANLPKEILDRHYKFVKHYEDNVKELKANLDGVEKAKTKAERKAKIAKARAHLEKTKPPRKHVPLDPNKLPFRTVKGKERVPRLKKEEFEKEFGPQKQKGVKTAGTTDGHGWTRILNSAIKQYTSPFTPYSSRVLLAANGPLTGLLSSDATPEIRDLPFSVSSVNSMANDLIPHSAFAIPNLENSSLLTPDTSQMLIAQATIDLPTADDLSETPEVQFTPEIRAKAQELGYNPVKIYEWVRNNIEFVPTYGSIQGAQMTMETKLGNAFDTASLLIALLRVSGISARYVYGTVEIPIEKAMNWVGGVTDPKMAGTILATNGIPAKVLLSGGTIKAVQLEHSWVEAYIPYGNYRGSMQDSTIKIWLSLDASYKQYEYKRGMDLYTLMAISGEKYIQDYITDTSSLAISDELKAAFPAYTISPYQYYSKRLFNYIDASIPDMTYQDIFGGNTIASSKTIIKKEYSYLLGSLPYNIITKAGTCASIPDNVRHKVSFIIDSTMDAGLSYVTSLSEIIGKRITISFAPATSADVAVVAQYETLLNAPPYLINVKPVLKVNGIIAATGVSIGLGQEQMFNMTFSVPNIGMSIVNNEVTAGDYSAIAILSNKVPVTIAGDKMETLINNIGSSDIDNLLGQMLYNVGVSYFYHVNFEEELYAKNFQMIVTKELSEAIITSHAVANSLFGVSYDISEGGIGIDVDKNEYSPFAYDGNQDRARDFMVVSGLGSSAWEDRVLQAFYDIPSVSAARLLRLANQKGIPIYTIDNENITALLSQLQVSGDVIDDIRNAVNAGNKVVISKSALQYEDWDGIGYIIIDTFTGAAGYMISGGIAGGMGGRNPSTSLRDVSQYYRDGSALRTIFGRTMVVLMGLALLDTPYIVGGEDPFIGSPPGFDCSGLVNYVFKNVYGNNIFGGVDRSADGQHTYLETKGMIHLYDEKLDGDILWSDGYGHTGIYYGIQGENIVVDSVIHATSSRLRTINGRIWIHKVVITSTNNDQFTGGNDGGIMSDIGRPVP